MARAEYFRAIVRIHFLPIVIELEAESVQFISMNFVFRMTERFAGNHESKSRFNARSSRDRFSVVILFYLFNLNHKSKFKAFFFKQSHYNFEAAQKN